MTDKLHFEDFAVGQRFELGESALTTEGIVAFARRWDPQPLHADVEAARTGPYGGIVASGWQVAGLWSQMFVHGFLFGVAAMGGPGMESLRLPAPARPELPIQGFVDVIDATPSAKHGHRGTVLWDGTLVQGETILVLRGRVYVRRRGT
jgi:acyl dehydratase